MKRKSDDQTLVHKEDTNRREKRPRSDNTSASNHSSTERACHDNTSSGHRRQEERRRHVNTSPSRKRNRQDDMNTNKAQDTPAKRAHSEKTASGRDVFRRQEEKRSSHYHRSEREENRTPNRQLAREIEEDIITAFTMPTDSGFKQKEIKCATKLRNVCARG